MIPIFEPYFKGNESKYLNQCIDSTWISSQGEFINKFENSLAEYHSVKFAIATSNCTTALHLSLKALGIGKGDQVICPNLTFIAPANMIVLSGAELVLVDIDSETLTIEPSILENKINDKTKAIIVVHQFGHSAHMDEIMNLAEKYNLKIIEDNAESLGASYKNKILGSFGDLATFSFFGNKILTTGEGGVVLTDNKELSFKCRELRDHGMDQQKKYHHVDLGYNYRMTNMQAAIGLAQMEKIDKIQKIRTEQMQYYYNSLNNIDGIKVRSFADWCDPVHWLMTITLDIKYDRDHFIEYMVSNNIDCRQMINPVSEAMHFKKLFKTSDFPISKRISNQSVHLPSSTGLSRENLNFIIDVVTKYFC